MTPRRMPAIPDPPSPARFAPLLAAARRAALMVVSLAAVAWPATAAAQDADPVEPSTDTAGEVARPNRALHDAGGHPFRTPAFSPLEPGTRVSVAAVSRDTASRWLALPDFGDRLPFWIRRAPGERWELAGALAAGAFSRFDLQGSNNEFIHAHYRVGLQLRARVDELAGRLELYHVSSHLGDEFLRRTGRVPVSTSREALELLVQAAPRSVVVYGGPGWIVRSTRSMGRASLRAGALWEPRWPGGSPDPYLGVEAFAWEELDWRPSITAEAGARLGRRIRVAAQLGFGPSRAEQFSSESERVLGVAFSLTP